jgi:hypothetical protein
MDEASGHLGAPGATPPGDGAASRGGAPRYTAAVASAGLALAACLVGLSAFHGVPLGAALSRFADLFASVDFNNGLFGAFGGEGAALVLAAWLGTALALRLAGRAIARHLSRRRAGPLGTALADTALAFTAALALLQAISFAGDFREESRPGAKPRSLTYQRLDEKVSKEAAQLAAMLPPRASVRFVTPLPWKKRDPAMYMERSLAFHLYPVDLTGLRREEPTHIVFYEQPGFAAHVPAGFEVVGKLSARTGVAAKKPGGVGR